MSLLATFTRADPSRPLKCNPIKIALRYGSGESTVGGRAKIISPVPVPVTAVNDGHVPIKKNYNPELLSAR